jgi:hypothetical protein
MNEHVITAISRGDKTKTFCIIEPLYITTLHKILITSLRNLINAALNHGEVHPEKAGYINQRGLQSLTSISDAGQIL